MFVNLPGRSRAEAFRIGAEIAAAVTAANPRPVKLQLEKARSLAAGIEPRCAR
jgi:DNA polymerase zeta